MIGKRGKILFAAALCVFSAFAVYESTSLWAGHGGLDGPAFVPLTVAVLFLILSVVDLICILKNVPAEDPGIKDEERIGTRRDTLIRISGCCLLIVLFCVMICSQISFWISSPVFLFALVTFLRKEKILKNLLITCVFTGFMYLVFVICFGVYLP